MSLTPLAHSRLAAALANAAGWHTEVLALDDERAIALVLVACSRLMLPYWESHYRGDDKMAGVVAAMNEWAGGAALESHERVRDAARRAAVEVEPDGYLSPAWPEPRGYDSPGDHAGDSIIAAANAILGLGSPEFYGHAEACLESAAEAVSQIIGHRQPDDESADIRSLALERIRLAVIDGLRGIDGGAL